MSIRDANRTDLATTARGFSTALLAALPMPYGHQHMYIGHQQQHGLLKKLGGTSSTPAAVCRVLDAYHTPQTPGQLLGPQSS